MGGGGVGAGGVGGEGRWGVVGGLKYPFEPKEP